MSTYIAHLIPEALSTTHAVTHDIPTRITHGQRWACNDCTIMLGNICKVLNDLEKGQSFDIIRKSNLFDWHTADRYDTVNPFGDYRGDAYVASWTFDIPQDVLHYITESGCKQIPLSLFRERAVDLSDMKPCQSHVTVSSEHIFEPGTLFWKPNLIIDERMRAFTHRLLRDFHQQWRHVLRRIYNHATLRTLCRAIIRLATLDFHVQESTDGHDVAAPRVWVTELPSWAPFESDIVRIGAVWVVLCEDVRKGLSIAQQHKASRQVSTESRSTTTSDQADAHYMILSVRHIMLCHAPDRGPLQHTAPEPLFNGDYDEAPASDLALDYLIWATTSAKLSIVTPILSLAVEIQDMILQYSAKGTVGAAKIGCMLGVGSPFSWKDGSRKVILQNLWKERSPGCDMEYEICFGERQSGLGYELTTERRLGKQSMRSLFGGQLSDC